MKYLSLLVNQITRKTSSITNDLAYFSIPGIFSRSESIADKFAWNRTHSYLESYHWNAFRKKRRMSEN